MFTAFSYHFERIMTATQKYIYIHPMKCKIYVLELQSPPINCELAL